VEIDARFAIGQLRQSKEQGRGQEAATELKKSFYR